MNEKLTKLWIGAQIRLRKFCEGLRMEETGAAEIVAIILIVAVVIVLVAVFRNRIADMIGTVFDSADSMISSPAPTGTPLS